jgi:hypothetical protein
MFTTRRSQRAITSLALLTVACAAAAAAGDAGRSAASAAAPSASSAASATERQRIASERAAAEARFAARERECRTRFVVTACIDEAKSERRDTLDKLRARQLGADEVRRRERAAERQSELAEKAAEDARLEKERAARAAAASASGAASQAPRLRISSPRRGAAPERAASAAGAATPRDSGPDKAFGLSRRASEPAAVRHDREARSRAAFEKRQRQAAEHREESATATLRRMASKSPAAALPAPSAASATKPR